MHERLHVLSSKINPRKNPSQRKIRQKFGQCLFWRIFCVANFLCYTYIHTIPCVAGGQGSVPECGRVHDLQPRPLLHPPLGTHPPPPLPHCPVCQIQGKKPNNLSNWQNCNLLEIIRNCSWFNLANNPSFLGIFRRGSGWSLLGPSCPFRRPMRVSGRFSARMDGVSVA